jgi:hypothetical protein
MTSVDDEMIQCWRVNYGLTQRTPDEAMRWWHDHNHGMAPAGAVAALGICLEEITRLRSARSPHDPLVPGIQS